MSACVNPYTGKDMFFILDPEHMLKSVRNALFSSGSHELATRRFLFHGEDIAWSFVKDAYQRDLQRQARGDFRRCPKIKRDTVELTAWLKMRVPLAKHVLCYYRLRAEMNGFLELSDPDFHPN